MNSPLLRKVSVSLRSEQRSHQYEIQVGKRLFNEKLVARLSKEYPAKSAVIFTDQKLVQSARRLKKYLESGGWNVQLSSLKVSEELKDLNQINRLYQQLFEFKANRNTLIFAVGGGVIGDAIGFVASTYLRGVPWISVPSTLLAQIDSGIGGKTGINHIRGKNLIGAFHQPSLVLCDVELLSTLEERDLVSGLGEMIKYGILFDRKFFNDLEKNWNDLIQGQLKSKSLILLIARCARWKSELVEKDEFDRLGMREILNFGHTLGHALEAVTAYRTFRHGEAIVWGMRAATRISWQKGYLSHKDYQKIESFLSLIPIPMLPKSLDPKKILEAVLHDKKKAASGLVRFVLLQKFGKAFSDTTVTEKDIFQVLNHFLRRPSRSA